MKFLIKGVKGLAAKQHRFLTASLDSHQALMQTAKKEKEWKPVRQPRDHPNYESIAENDPLRLRPVKTWFPVSLELKDTEVRAYRTDPVQVRSCPGISFSSLCSGIHLHRLPMWDISVV
nr:methionine--tRNA ligase, mitochondrial [Ipomoea batatas]